MVNFVIHPILFIMQGMVMMNDDDDGTHGPVSGTPYIAEGACIALRSRNIIRAILQKYIVPSKRALSLIVGVINHIATDLA